MKIRYDDEAGVSVVEPDDPEELVPVPTDDAEARKEAEIIVTVSDGSNVINWRIVGPDGRILGGNQ